MLKVFASDKRYAEINHLQTLIMVASNPHMHFGEVDVDRVLLPVLVETLKDEQAHLMENAFLGQILGGLEIE